jgi:uncharacterized protein (DUF488 family)
MPKTIFTLGFHNLTLVDFIRLVKDQDVFRVVDIRSQDMIDSNRGKFSPRQLKAILKNINVDYVHLPEVGMSEEVKLRAKSNGTKIDLIKDYIAKLSTDKNIIKKVISLFSDDKVLILCFEESADVCIRKPFSDLVKTILNEEIKVKNLSSKDLKPLVIPPPESVY